MPKFRFTIFESNQGEIVVEAENYDEATIQAHDLYHQGAVEWRDVEMSVNLDRSED